MARTIIGPNAQIPEKAKRKSPVRSRAPKPLPDTAIVMVYLDRTTGKVSIDQEFATPLEARCMLGEAADQLYAKLEEDSEENNT